MTTSSSFLRIVFEKETCGRCGGCGNYSYCQQYGTMCFGCNGTGKRLSRRGKIASQKVQAFKVDRYSVPATEIEPGDRIVYSMLEGRKRATVVAVKADPLNEGHVHIETKTGGLGVLVDSLVEKIPTVQQFADEVIPYARRFKGATIEEIQ